MRRTVVGSGEWLERRRRESLMVGPVRQPAAWSEDAAAEREASSRWPRQMEMVRSRDVPVARRASASGLQRGCRRIVVTSSGAAAPVTVARSPDNYESDNVPSTARFVRGRWEYGRVIATPRGRSLRWFQSSAFTAGELDNAHFSQLRLTATAGQAAMVNLIQWELNN